MKSQLNIIDLFSGCGGFSLGAHFAGFNSLLAVDIDPILSSSFPLNFPNTRLLNADLGTIDSSVLTKLVGSKKVHGIIGGPPCQGFSTMGKRDKNDPRNTLITHFFRHVSAIKPDFFIMENVPGLLSSEAKPILDEAIEVMKKEYEIIPPFVVNAHDYGAATNRKRMILIGYKSEAINQLTQEMFRVLSAKYLTKDALLDLPDPETDNWLNDYEWKKYTIEARKCSAYAQRARSLPPKGLGSKEAISKLKAGYLSGFQNTVHSNTLVERYGNLLPGSADKISKSVKLSWDKPSNTLRAGTGREKGSFQAVRPIHPSKPRVITVREAARLQGFPDWFLFHHAKWHSFRMIGNSVSPYMSEGILSVIARNFKTSPEVKKITQVQYQCSQVELRQAFAEQ